ncbi:MAG: glycoside hydrolase family 32 protein [Planctomycetota bacterium]|nr:glycoside hydrolase family 32 protein [Planctomycetota bacterium]
MTDNQTEADKLAQEIERVGTLTVSARDLREIYQQDPHRPRYHLMAPEEVFTALDPQACIFWKGRYHMFYCYVPPEGTVYGHASSADMVHWTFHPKAIGIFPGDPDTHVWAGGAFVNKDGVPTIIYNGLNAGACLATSTDDGLIHWTKHPGNPVIRDPKEGSPDFGKYKMWDVCGWKDGDFHYCLNGGNTKEDGDVAWLFRSRDLVGWEYVHPFYKSDRRWTGIEEDCSCPDFFPLGDKHVLMFISHARGTQYYVGRYENETFYPEQHGRMNWPGGSCFAQETLLDDKGRRIMWAWVPDQRTRQRALLSGWSEVFSVPRVVSLAKDGSLRIEPVEELNVLRYDHHRHEKVKLAADAEWIARDIAGDCLELSLEVELADAKEFTVNVRCSAGGEEQTAIVCNPATKTLAIDTTRSTLSQDVVQPFPSPFISFFTDTPLVDGRQDVRVQVAPFDLKGQTLRLRIYLDRSMLEVFANGRQCLTQRIYPSRPDSMGVSLVSRGGAATLRRLDAWKMHPTNQW